MHIYVHVSTLLTDPEFSDLIFLDQEMKSVTKFDWEIHYNFTASEVWT